ncbi:VapC toxin family PIN domain ribonuclease [Halobacteriales archaeon QH_10_67_22]|jgi:predicted nucleic acid-binding protein|nr:MAG: VapC toxin family PIN domain ribonuclease [Halobacteriales archaeon QH_10_67_22]
MILDTTFLVDLLHGSETVSERVTDLDTSGTPFVSSITVMELFEGVHLADMADAERTAVTDLLTETNELPFDRECAMRAGEINASLVESGSVIDETDVMIAATALVNDYPVVTRNVDHFERVDGLEVVSY